ncbi:MAG: hypothetical protein ACFCU6_03090 [Balneolaceae bacterium]
MIQPFLSKIIDYAGLFPPAGLPLDQVVVNYSAYQKSEFNWMLSKMIIPVDKIRDLKHYRGSQITKELPFRVSVLGSKEETVEEFQLGTDRLLGELEWALDELKGYITTDAFETKLPSEAVESNDQDLLVELLNETATRFEQVENAPSVLFYEAGLTQNPGKQMELITSSLAEHNRLLAEENFEQTQRAGFKFRCGGTSAGEFPSVELLSSAICYAREALVPVKFTAGLHHPLRHYNESVKTKMHGFLNVFGAGLLAYAYDLNKPEIEQILLDEDPASFGFEDDGFRYDDMIISAEEIRDLRESAFLSFGSCSFDDPVEDLKTLGIL